MTMATRVILVVDLASREATHRGLSLPCNFFVRRHSLV
jgi:hypothetical protein